MPGTIKRILWIDDEIEFLRSHVAFLETRGYAVTTASGGDAGLRFIREGGAFDIVLLDRQMPVKSGATTFDEIKAHRPDLPVVMLTGCQHAADAALEKKYDGCLTKPVDPGKLLLECTRLIGAKERASRKFYDRYLRDYTENRTRLGGVLSASGWMNLYTSLAKWDLELEVDAEAGEGVRQMHAGLKSDSAAKFCDFAVDSYAGWAAGRAGRPLMAADALEKAVAPELDRGRGVIMVVLSGMTLGQFLAIEPELKRSFSVAATRFVSALPTVSQFCLPALASGFYPAEVAGLEPDFFGAADGVSAAAMKRLMAIGLERAGAAPVKTYYACADGANGRRHLKTAADTMKKSQAYGVLTLDVVNKFTKPAGAGKPPGESAPDDAAFRGQIESWFAGSAILAMMREVCDDSRTVILTSDRGHVRCGRASEIYETGGAGRGLRHMFAQKVSVDERQVFLLEELPHFRLPAFAPGTKCLMARENFCFALPPGGEAGGAKRGAAGGFRSGGISPEEMILPLYVCRPFGSGK